MNESLGAAGRGVGDWRVSACEARASALATLGPMLDPESGPAEVAGRAADPADLSGGADLAGLSGRADLAGLSGAADVDLIRALEDVKNAACAVQAVVAVRFARTQRAEQARRGVPPERVGRGVAEQVALARRESPHAAAIFLGMATILAAEMPHTLRAMSAGVLTERRARLVVQETACLTREARGEIDERVCADLARLETLGTKRLGNLVRGEAARRDPAGVADRLGHAATERFVSLRPAPDCMTRLTALLPVAPGVSVLAALTRAADAARAGGDPRSRGQVMADELIVRITGQTAPDAIPVALHLIMPADTLLSGRRGDGTGDGRGDGTGDGRGDGTGDGRGDGAAIPDGDSEGPLHGDLHGEAAGMGDGAGDEPARILGWGPVPGPVARRLVGQAPRLGSWVRRLYAAPSGGLVTMESRRRLFPHGLGEFITIRDDICRTPFCDAPIRHLDHITPNADVGETSAANGQGLCERCNHAKQALGWTAHHNAGGASDAAAQQQCPPTVGNDGRAPGGVPSTRHRADSRHEVTITTPTGHQYKSPSPDLAQQPVPRAARGG